MAPQLPLPYSLICATFNFVLIVIEHCSMKNQDQDHFLSFHKRFASGWVSDSVISSLLGLFFSEKYIFFFFWNIKDVKHSTTMHGNHCLMQLCWTQWKYKICLVEHFFKRAFVQKNICSNEYLFQRILVQKNICSNEYLFQRIFVQKGARLICERSKH